MNPEEFARQLNHVMVDLLLQGGQIKTLDVEKAFRKVLRHKFLPKGMNIAEVYQDKTIILKQSATDGLPLSSSTMPGLLASILEAANLKPGMRVMQIGTGPGYLAALIGHLVTASGAVVTIEVDADIAKTAREQLDYMSYGNIQCVVTDGSLGYTQQAPYQRIIVSASCANVPEAWMDQLEENGLLILPFSLSQRASLYPMLSFKKTGNHFIGKVASSLVTVGFIPLCGKHVTYQVLYEKSITKVETSVFRNLRDHYKGTDYKAIALIVLLEIAKATELMPEGIDTLEPMELTARSINLWKQLKNPRIEDFRFYLLPRTQTIGSYIWHFSKEHNQLFVTVRSNRPDDEK